MTDIPDGIQLTAFDETFYKDPYAVYKRLREAEPVHRDGASFYEGGSYSISEFEIVKALLSDNRLSVDPRTVGLRRDPRADNPVTLREPDMMNLDNPEHHRLRSLVQKAFTPSSITNFEPDIKRIVASCFDAISDDSFDVVKLISKPVPTIVIAGYIGVNSEDHEQFKAWTDALLLQGYPMPTDEQWRTIVDADTEFREYVTSVIQERRDSPENDLISRLLVAQDEGKLLSDQEVVDMCQLLIGAGNFTTTDLISNSIYQMIESGTDATAEQIVEETLRFDPPSLNARRFVKEDIEVSGVKIPKGSVVNLLTGAANHDPKAIQDPDTFNPKRETVTNLAFGRGAHHCLGASLAKLEATIVVEEFRERYPNARISNSKRTRRMDFRGFQQLIVEI